MNTRKANTSVKSLDGIIELSFLQFNVLWRTVDDYYPLAIGSEHICSIGEYPIVAIAA